MLIPGAPRGYAGGIVFDPTSLGISAGSSVLGSLIGAGASSSAARTQARAASAAAQALGQAGASAQNFLNPYVAGGANSYNNLLANPTFGQTSTNYLDNAYDSTTQASNENNDALGVLNQGRGVLTNLANGGITQQSIENLPGYAAINALGQQGVTNSAAARGLANSGAALKGAASYATTMADQSYQNLYQDQLGTAQALNQNASTGINAAANQLGVAGNYLGVNSGYQGNIDNTFNRQNALAGYGLTGAQDSVQNALTAAGASNSAALSGANALASGTIGGANALSTGISNAGQVPMQYLLYQKLLSGGGGGSSGAPAIAAGGLY